jgi:Tfp pilus assembly protein PilZ
MTAAEAEMIKQRDEAHLRLATSQSRALYSFNVRDYHEIHTQWTATGLVHGGIILATQKRYSTGEQIRRLLRLIGSVTQEQMRGREEFLGGWGALTK